MTPKRPILWKLAQWVISHFPPHDIYVEPFGGAASVLLQKNRTRTEVWNDLSDDLVHLFSLLRNPKLEKRLVQNCAMTPFSRSEFNQSYEQASDPVERARRFIVRSFFGYGSKSTVSITRNGFRCLRSGDNSPAVDWSGYPPIYAPLPYACKA